MACARHRGPGQGPLECLSSTFLKGQWERGAHPGRKGRVLNMWPRRQPSPQVAVQQGALGGRGCWGQGVLGAGGAGGQGALGGRRCWGQGALGGRGSWGQGALGGRGSWGQGSVLLHAILHPLFFPEAKANMLFISFLPIHFLLTILVAKYFS